MRHLNRWSLSSAWVATMVVGWFTLVPSVLSASSWALASIAGLVFIISAAAFWETSRPTPSFRQSQVEADTVKVTGRRR